MLEIEVLVVEELVRKVVVGILVVGELGQKVVAEIELLVAVVVVEKTGEGRQRQGTVGIGPRGQCGLMCETLALVVGEDEPGELWFGPAFMLQKPDTTDGGIVGQGGNP